MTYYLLLEEDTEQDALFSSNILGEESFGKFWPDEGLKALYTMKNQKPHLLSQVVVKNEKNEKLTLEEFLDVISTLKIEKEKA